MCALSIYINDDRFIGFSRKKTNNQKEELFYWIEEGRERKRECVWEKANEIEKVRKIDKREKENVKERATKTR